MQKCEFSYKFWQALQDKFTTSFCLNIHLAAGGPADFNSFVGTSCHRELACEIDIPRLASYTEEQLPELAAQHARADIERYILEEPPGLVGLNLHGMMKSEQMLPGETLSDALARVWNKGNMRPTMPMVCITHSPKNIDDWLQSSDYKALPDSWMTLGSPLMPTNRYIVGPIERIIYVYYGINVERSHHEASEEGPAGTRYKIVMNIQTIIRHPELFRSMIKAEA